MLRPGRLYASCVAFRSFIHIPRTYCCQCHDASGPNKTTRVDDSALLAGSGLRKSAFWTTVILDVNRKGLPGMQVSVFEPEFDSGGGLTFHYQGQERTPCTPRLSTASLGVSSKIQFHITRSQLGTLPYVSNPTPCSWSTSASSPSFSITVLSTSNPPPSFPRTNDDIKATANSL